MVAKNCLYMGVVIVYEKLPIVMILYKVEDKW